MFQSSCKDDLQEYIKCNQISWIDSNGEEKENQAEDLELIQENQLSAKLTSVEHLTPW